MKILEVADRPGWAVDRLSKPLSGIYDNVDIAYFNTKEHRYLDTGYSKKEGNVQYTDKLANKYDVVHFHKVKSASLVVGRMKPSIRKIISVHNEHCFDEIDWSPFDDVICPTKYCLEEMSKRHKKVHYVPYGIDLNKYYHQFKMPNPNAVGHVGRIVEHKRFNTLADAMGSVKLQLIACGYVDDSRILKRINREVKYYKFMKLVTLLPEVQMNNFYSFMNLYVCISEPHYETGPLPVLEAMACGIPVLSTEVGWAKDWCTHEKDIWFIKDDVAKDYERLGKTIKNIFDRLDVRVKLRDNALHLIKDFSIENYAEKLMEIYKK